MILSDNIWSKIVCPSCSGHLLPHEYMLNNGFTCSGCGSTYRYARSGLGGMDLRLQKPKTYKLDFQVGVPVVLPTVEPLRCNETPAVDFSSMKKIPRHLTKALLSYFPRATSADSLVLDLGCGNGPHQGVCEQAGFEWVGLDYDSQKAPILGDAHALPFADNTFSFVLSIAVLEHIQFPFVVMQEVYRVLKPHGKFIGTVSFLEPFHDNSYYHHTHLGVCNSLQYGGLLIEKLAPDEVWTGLNAQAYMTFFPGMPRAISQALMFPMRQFINFWWWMGGHFAPKLSKNIRIRNSTGAFTFVTEKCPNELVNSIEGR